MWGEHRLASLAAEYDATDGQAFLALMSPQYSAALGLAKLAATVLTISAGYPGGIVYGLVFAGYMLGPMTWHLASHALPPLAALDDVAALVDYSLDFVGPPSPRGITAEICAQALGAALLAGVLRVPLGATLLVGLSAGASEPMYALLLLSCFVAVYVNPRSPSGQPDN